jgi:pilus assembly protein CpaE
LLVDVSGCDDIFDAVNRLADACEPETRVIVIGSFNDVGTYRRLLDAGITDYLVKPVTSEAVAAALGRARSPTPVRAPAPAPEVGNSVIAVVGTRGGVGATSIAISVACALAHQRKLHTVLIDLDLQLGSAAINLDLEPSRGFRDILQNPERMDSLLVGSALTQESDRLRVLSAEEPLDSEVKVGADALRTLLDLLKQDKATIVLDVSRRVDSLTRSALNDADIVCVVTDLSLAGMRDSKRLMDLARGARRRSSDRSRPVLLVANRISGAGGEVPQAEFERGTGAKFDFVLPYDAKAAAAAADGGKSLLAGAGSGALHGELNRLVATLSGVSAEPAEQAKRSWVKRLLGK